MSDRELDISLTNSTAKTLSHLPPSEAEREEYKAKLAVVYERGLVIDMLHVDIPDDVHGQWVSRTGGFVERMQLLGYKVDDLYAVKKSLHDQGDGTANVGDVVFMTIPKWKKEVQDDIIKKRYYETHLRDRRKLKEEKDFDALQRGLGMPSMIGSNADDVSGVQIEDSLTKTG